MILGRPFLATIHAEIDVFNKEISSGIENDMSFTSSNAQSDKSPPFEKSNNLYHENNDDDYMQERRSKNARMLKPDTNTPSAHFCNPVKQNCNGILKGNDEIWEKCKKVQGDNTYWWHDHGLEDNERLESGLDIEEYNPPEVHVETFEKRKRIKVQRNDQKRIGHMKEGPKKDVERLEPNLKTR
ncbi:hypothetical protein Tco_1489923 [Tanacetum coccineum]